MEQVRHSLGRVGYHFGYILLTTFLAYWSATVGWRYCFEDEIRTPGSGALFVIRHIGEMVSLVNPASVVGGEATKIYLLKNRGIDAASSMTSVLLSRLLMAITQVLLFLVTTALVIFNNREFFANLPSLQLSVMPVLIAMLAVIVCLILWRNRLYLFQKMQIPTLRTHLNARFDLEKVFTDFRQFFKTNQKGMFLASLFFLIHWIIGSLEIYLILYFLGIKAGFAEVIFVDMGIVIFKSAGAFVPGQIGVEELGNKVMLGLIGIPDDSVWITVSVLRRARQLFWICFGGIIYLLFFKQLRGLEKPA